MSASLLSVVREAPPLRLNATIETPRGRHYRWGLDESNPENVLTEPTFSSTMPGGFENGSCVLERNPFVDYDDLTEFSTLTFEGVGGQAAGEYRLEQSPRTSGNQMAITPQAVGWQAHLQDDNAAAMIFIDQSLSSWQGPSVARQVYMLGSNWSPDGPSTATGASGLPALSFVITGPWDATATPSVEAWYDSGTAAPIAKLYYAGSWNTWSDGTVITPELAMSSDGSTLAVGENLAARNAGGNPLSPTVYAPGTYRYAAVLLKASQGATNSNSNQQYVLNMTNLAVLGNHGLTVRGSWPATWNASTGTLTGGIGLLASDMITYALAKWAPMLSTTDQTGASSITPSTFVIPQAAYTDPTTASAIVTDLTKYELQDWGVWERKTFFWYPRNARGRRWRTRINDCQLSETGPDSTRIWNGVVVSYTDAAGVTRTVGPPGSGCDATDASLLDTDPANPANQLLQPGTSTPIRRWSLLAMGLTSTANAAIQVGAVFLKEQKLLDSSGQANLVGTAVDEHGIVHPAWMVRAGDQLAVVDASDPSYRRIVSASYTDSSKTCAVNLDAPPDGLQALLDRLGVVIQPLGIS